MFDWYIWTGFVINHENCFWHSASSLGIIKRVNDLSSHAWKADPDCRDRDITHEPHQIVDALGSALAVLARMPRRHCTPSRW
jgi:hypothetical protein